MKILVTALFKMVRFGEFVSADEAVGEFVVDTENSQLSKATLSEICTKNKIPFSKKATVGELLEAIEEAVPGLKIPEQNQEPDSVKVRRIVEEYLADENDDEDEILMAIVQSGVKFKVAGKLYKQAMIDLGALVSNKDRWTSAKEIMVADGFEPKNWEEVDAMCNRLVKEIPATEYSKAYAQIRKYAKEFEIELPKPEKKTGGGFKHKIYAWMVANPSAEKDAFYSYVTRKMEKEEKVADRYWEIFELAKKVAAAAAAE